jgi:transcriptional regulator with XRE-family HTH domain
VKIERYLTDEAVLAELGARLERTRLERNLSQRELAEEAGVERKAVQRIEAGEPVKLASFIRVLRGLDLLDALDQLVPKPLPSPIELLKLHGKRRRRASGARRKRAPERKGASGQGGPPGRNGEKTPPTQDAEVPWRWGDETPAAGA